ncbi:hypothetical protein [Rubneribacter badeniensis]|uniref:hypothetical protein n=1 Tax=Rubneribacter badeniensis TaxID=2070688 RepID=UPI000B551743|nr:hypothetical protein [Rubneribacter badeniensis]OUO95324.1 hypothetical protein B5F41_06900 [Gordonibacter sp. An232A]
MPNQEENDARESLSKVCKVCKFLNFAMKSIFLVFCFWWTVSSLFMACSLMNLNSFFSVGNISVVGLFLYILDGVVIGVMLAILIKVFSDAANGESPFSMIQVRRLRKMSLALVGYAIIDFGISCNAAFLHYDGRYSAMEDPVITINFAPFIAAAVVFAFSFVFKYGVLLQEFSDETL